MSGARTFRVLAEGGHEFDVDYPSSTAPLTEVIEDQVADGKLRPHCLPGITAGAQIAAKTGKEPITLIVKDGDHFRVVPIDYHGGLRYPRLERIEGKPDLLSKIYEPLK